MYYVNTTQDRHMRKVADKINDLAYWQKVPGSNVFAGCFADRLAKVLQVTDHASYVRLNKGNRARMLAAFMFKMKINGYYVRDVLQRAEYRTPLTVTSRGGSIVDIERAIEDLDHATKTSMFCYENSAQFSERLRKVIDNPQLQDRLTLQGRLFLYEYSSQLYHAAQLAAHAFVYVNPETGKGIITYNQNLPIGLRQRIVLENWPSGHAWPDTLPKNAENGQYFDLARVRFWYGPN